MNDGYSVQKSNPEFNGLVPVLIPFMFNRTEWILEQSMTVACVKKP